MGKRGPTPGTRYGRRANLAGSISILTDRELVAAQHFCDHLNAVLTQLERGEYPVPLLKSPVRERLHKTAESVHHSIIGGIEAYYHSRPDDEE